MVACDPRSDEVELIQAMYSEEGEFVLEDVSSFTVRLMLDNIPLYLYISLPEGYPDVPLDFRISCERLSRESTDNLAQSLRQFLDPLIGELCVTQVLDWLLENVPSHLAPDTKSDHSIEPRAEQPRKGLRKGSCCTMWEEHCDLFDVEIEWSLCHCVSKDLAMTAGIAVEFKKRFGGLPELQSQGVEVGGVAVLQKGERFIYYLVTKNKYGGKPTMTTLQASLKAMREHMLKHDVKKLAMPHIGCGLDRLCWPAVQDLVLDVFDADEVELLACKN